MSQQKENNNKIGARCLSDSEAELILPTYKRIYYQIDQFRKEKEQRANSQDEDQSSKNPGVTQKTNNIGIIGFRGAGKTSVLKTIRVHLEREKRDKISKINDIILPIIVPENMSESGNLMATILGMLGEVIEERDKKEKKEKKKYNADCIRKTSLQLKYDEVVKQYTYIQKEYRDILIHQYTTENDYVDRSAKVFSSDTEFINKFNELIDELVKTSNQEDNSSLLFLFIDDIDLSTYRCADVVKTLLSYLSNENIVTFISGDLETFEEALSLDFLRQENVLDKNILDKKVGNTTLLDSKKKLAYEYLKKIIPPAYRYNIKYWTLEEMGNYCIADSVENQGQEEHGNGHPRVGIRLSELLPKALKDWVDPAFFCYGDEEEEREKDNESPKRNANYDGKPQAAWKALPYTYHLFDNTSRGLNNIYNVLSEIAAERENQEKDFSKEKKLLLDTIISSKPIYNKYRDKIQQNFFNVGMTEADNRVFFDNAMSIIYKKQVAENNADGSQKQEEYQGIYQIKDPTERFSLFILVDFAARLLYEKDYEKQVKKDELYRVLKEEAMKDLFFHPIIADKVMDVPKCSWKNKEASKNGKKTELALKDMELKDINISFLLKGDLVLNLAYYKNLPLNEMLNLYKDKDKNDKDKAEGESSQEALATAELEQGMVIAVWRAFSSIASVNADGDVSQIVARYYSVFWKEFAYIRNQMSSSVTQNIAIRLFDNEINDVLNKDKKCPGLKERIQMGRILSNTLARMLKAEGADEIEDEWQEIYSGRQYVILKNKEETEIGTEKAAWEDIEMRIQILKVIDSKELWQEEPAEEVVSYLKKTVKQYLKLMKESMEEKDWKLNTSVANESWEKFKKTDKGVSSTVAKRTFNDVNRILNEMQTDFSYRTQVDFAQGMALETYRTVIGKLEELAGNTRVWYGRSEAQEILNKLQEASAEPLEKPLTEITAEQKGMWDSWIRKHSYFVFLLQCLYKYKIEIQESNNIKKNASLLADITQKLSVAHKDADRQTLEDFIGRLNEGLENNIDSEDFEKLFS